MTGIGKVADKWRATFRGQILGDFPTKKEAIGAVKSAQKKVGLYTGRTSTNSNRPIAGT